MKFCCNMKDREAENPKCIYYKGHATVSFTGNEVLIKDGSISRQEIDDKIAETFRQLNIDFDLD